VNRFIAIVILIAIAITIAAIGIAWITTTMHTMMWKPEILKIIEMKLNQLPNGTWILKIEATNIGEGDAEIYKIAVTNIEEKTLDQPITIEPGHTKEFTIPLTKQYQTYTTYTVRLYLKTGTVYNTLEYIVTPK
jgi:hypothetical protein